MVSDSTPPDASSKKRSRSRQDYFDLTSFLEFSLFTAIILLSGCRRSGPPYSVADALNL